MTNTLCQRCGGDTSQDYAIRVAIAQGDSNTDSAASMHLCTCPPFHDGTLEKRLAVEIFHFAHSPEQMVSLFYSGNPYNPGKTRYLNMSPQEALSLLDWLIQEREHLTALAKEQAR